MSAQRKLLADLLHVPAPEGPDAIEPELIQRIAPNLLLPDEESEAVRERMGQLISSLKPRNTFEMWLTGRVALQEIRLLRCRAQEVLLRDQLARRAVLCWDEDRRAEVGGLAAKLSRRPEEIAPKLGRTRHGCEWLLACWSSLETATEPWDDAARKLALDLLGIPRATRSGRTVLDPPPGVDAAAHLRGVVAGEIERLRSRLASALESLDATDRQAAALGAIPDEAPELVRLRRAERSHEVSLRWYLAQFKKIRAAYEPDVDYRQLEASLLPPVVASGEPAAEAQRMAPEAEGFPPIAGQVKTSPIKPATEAPGRRSAPIAQSASLDPMAAKGRDAGQGPPIRGNPPAVAGKPAEFRSPRSGSSRPPGPAWSGPQGRRCHEAIRDA